MATIESPPNSVWPNGLQTDSEGYVNFYPLGTNKVDISTITWPEGTEVKSPFVYQDDKLVGFIDTKALDIDNNDTTININYTHFDADLDSIMENTLTINAPANAVVNVKYGAVDKVLTEKIEKLIGKEKCEVKFDKNNNKATFVFALDATDEQIANVENLLNHVLPTNLTTEMEWSDGLPMTYTRLEYLEGTGTQFIDTGVEMSNKSDVSLNFKAGATMPRLSRLFGSWASPHYFSFLWVDRFYRFYYGTTASSNNFNIPYADAFYFEKKGNVARLNDEEKILTDREFSCRQCCLYSNQSLTYEGFVGCIYSFSISRNNQLQLNFIPCLDDTGTPCMFDTVTRTSFRNKGSGDFIIGIETQQQLDSLLDSFPNYTGQAIEKLQITLAEALRTPENEARLAEAMAQNSTMPAMLSLDGEFVAPKFYAQLTEHGVRRLYHVPKGYTSTMDEYAAANGFKELVEPPMPSEGYWMPEWRETETQLICDWVETEPPAEEV